MRTVQEFPMPSYCEYIRANPDPLHSAYHDTQYGFPLTNDAALFGRLVLEINQAGLSWTTILKKQEAFLRAYDGFEPALVAAYGEADRERLLGDATIIRNRLKVDAAIANAQRILELQAEYGSFKAWLDMHSDLDLEGWTRLFKKTFRFTGREIVKEFLVSTGYLPGAHDEDCPVFARIAQIQSPPGSTRGAKTDR
jgi:DNA-3-methyladenine glycosylase I